MIKRSASHRCLETLWNVLDYCWYVLGGSLIRSHYLLITFVPLLKQEWKQSWCLRCHSCTKGKRWRCAYSAFSSSVSLELCQQKRSCSQDALNKMVVMIIIMENASLAVCIGNQLMQMLLIAYSICTCLKHWLIAHIMPTNIEPLYTIQRNKVQLLWYIKMHSLHIILKFYHI